MDNIATQLYDAAQLIVENSYSPYSQFPVGAAIRLDDGSIYSGCNIENASFSLTMCAEAVAIAKAIDKKTFTITHALVLAKKMPFCPPCGACRQRLLEFSLPDTVIYLSDTEANIQSHKLSDLIPASFSL